MRAPSPVVIMRSAPPAVVLKSALPCCNYEECPPPLSFCGAPPPCHSEERPPPCHSEERTTKNLRCWLMRWLAVGMGWPSKGDLRFLTPFGMTVGGSFGKTVYYGHSGEHLLPWHSGECPLPCRSEERLPPCHSEERTPKNLRCRLMLWLVVGMVRPSEGDLRFLTAFGMT